MHASHTLLPALLPKILWIPVHFMPVWIHHLNIELQQELAKNGRDDTVVSPPVHHIRGT